MATGATHSFLTPTIIAREALRLLKNNLVMGNAVYRAYESEFPGSPKKGGTVTIRKPNKFQVTKSRTRKTTNITEASITLTVATQAHVSWAFHMVDLTLSIEEYSERYIRPAAAVLANTVDSDLCDLYKDVWNSVHESTGIITPNTFMAFGKAMQRLDEEACPADERTVVLNPAAHWSMANALSALYVQEAAAGALRKGYLGRIAGAEVFMDQNIKTFSSGAWHTSDSNVTSAVIESSTGAVSRAATGSSVTICDLKIVTTGAFRAGDVITFAGVFAVNPMSGESTGVLRQFVITADASCLSVTTATGALVYVKPDFVDTGAGKIIDTLPACGAKVTVLGYPAKTAPQNLAFHKNAFALVMVPLERPDGVWGSTITEDGFSIRIVKAYEIDEDDEVCRLDILYGVKTIYPELAVRIWGAQTTTA